ncbi:MAG: glycoside hydrolase family 3 N-terminal domain-containing protein [Caldimicrobium sp.]
MFKTLGKIFLVKPKELSIKELSFYKELSFRNFIFFKEHFLENFDEYREFLRERIKVCKILAVDQEGGRVIRIPGDFASPYEASKKYDLYGEEYFLEWAKSLALSVKEKGLNLNLSPVVDLAGEEAEEFLRFRTFGDDPQKVSKLAEKFIEVHRTLGIETCLKHFPGLGGVKIDPHKELPIKRNFTEADLFPFRTLSGKVKFIMTTHLLLTDFDKKPTTFSDKLIKFLRNDIGFKGVIITDDIAMGALDSYPLEERILSAIASGHNLIIFTGNWEELLRALFEIKREIERSSSLKENLKVSLSILEGII